MLSAPIELQLKWMEDLYGAILYDAFDPELTLKSPIADDAASHWIRTAKTVGINVRTIGSFWHILPYMLTQPAAYNAVHILPIWEPGVVASLYGPASWNINPEFFNTDLQRLFPALDTVEKQLKVVVNLLHATGRVVGMDVVPHTDRYSEMALANPRFFEWLQRADREIVRHDDSLVDDVERCILDFVRQFGPADTRPSLPDTPEGFFIQMPEDERLKVLFGQKYDYQGRLRRRNALVQWLYDRGLETAPATMGPPYRGLEVDPNPAARVIDDEGREWRDYRITRPQSMSRVFGPLSRYRLYESLDNNRDWALDFDRPNKAAWEYVCQHYRAVRTEFGFDFMRGDMSHVQMRPGGVPAQPDEWYDLLGAVKKTIAADWPPFAYFAESFLAPPNTMAYGDECDHLEASRADATLGNLQSEPVGSPEFISEFARYRNLLDTRKFAPGFTLFTADKDDPRFDSYYLDGNEIRYFLSLFLTDMPAYMGLGFECRDPHPEPAPNEFYSKLYVFHVKDGPKSTRGPYRWGQNHTLNNRLARQKSLADQICPSIDGASVKWLIPPDPEGWKKCLVWTQSGEPRYLFVANLDTSQVADLFLEEPANQWRFLFSTADDDNEASQQKTLPHLHLLPGEGLVFEKKITR